MFNDNDRDIRSIRLPTWGRVAPAEGTVPWLVVDDDGVPVEPIRRYLADFVAQETSLGSVRSYAYALLRWWRWLRAVGVEWDKATPAEARDLVLWLKQATKPRRSPRTVSAATAATVNPITRKRHLGDGYEPRTIRHSNAVVRAFYEFWIEDIGRLTPPRGHRRGVNHFSQSGPPSGPTGHTQRMKTDPAQRRDLLSDLGALPTGEYQYTVCQCGKSAGSCPHMHQVRTTYRIASTTAVGR